MTEATTTGFIVLSSSSITNNIKMMKTSNNICSYVVGCLESNTNFNFVSRTGQLRSFIRTEVGQLQLETFLEKEKELAPFLIALAGDVVPTDWKDSIIDSFLNELQFTSHYARIMKQFMNGTTDESFQEFVKKQPQKGMIRQQWFMENGTTVRTRKKTFGKGHLLPCEIKITYLNICLLVDTYSDTGIVSKLWGQSINSCCKRKNELREKFVSVASQYDHIDDNSNVRLHSSRTPSQSGVSPQKKKNRPSSSKTPSKLDSLKLMSLTEKKNKVGNRKGTGDGTSPTENIDIVEFEMGDEYYNSAHDCLLF